MYNSPPEKKCVHASKSLYCYFKIINKYIAFNKYNYEKIAK